MSSHDADVLIIGAGAAGLAALNKLHHAGVKAIAIEARGRIGGRIHTIHDALSPVPVELGAEFVHGRPEETWDIVRQAGLTIYETEGKSVRAGSDEPGTDDDAVWRLMVQMEDYASKESDLSFDAFLAKVSYPARAKALATAFVEGFNAAHADIIGIAGLAEDAQAAAAIDGDRSFRVLNGYDAVVNNLLGGLESKLLLNCVVEGIEWKRGQVRAHTRSTLTNNHRSFSARHVVVTVPLGVLQTGGIRFSPEPETHLYACRRLALGQVFRVVLRFKEAFWLRDERFADAGFIFSNEQCFPTWWTTLPVPAPVLTAWSAGSHADPLLGRSEEEVMAEALKSLAQITQFPNAMIQDLLRSASFHDWHADPFARGAYSYVPAGALAFRKTLASPAEQTLYFAGEATDLGGHSATVHGAIASGRRAAAQVLADAGKTES